MAPSLPTLAERRLAIGDVGFAAHYTPISFVLFARGRIALRVEARRVAAHLSRAGPTIDAQAQAHRRARRLRRYGSSPRQKNFVIDQPRGR
jgi:hypothetical protein